MSNPYIPQVWMVEPLDGSAGDYPLHLPSDEDLGVSEVNWKTHDGTHFMHTFDRRGVASAAAFRDLVGDFVRRGIACSPWCVPTGRDLAAEIQIASAVIEASRQPAYPHGVMVFDVEVENTPHFWKGTAAEARAYMAELRRRFPLARFVLQFDVRWPTELNYFAWVGQMDLAVGMDYWTDFGEAMETTLARAWTRQRQLRQQAGRPELAFSYTFPGTADAYPHWQIDERPIYIFRRGNMTSACVALVQGGRGEEPPAPPDPVQEYRAAWVAELRGIIRAADDDAIGAAVRRADALAKLRALGETP